MCDKRILFKNYIQIIAGLKCMPILNMLSCKISYFENTHLVKLDENKKGNLFHHEYKFILDLDFRFKNILFHCKLVIFKK